MVRCCSRYPTIGHGALVAHCCSRHLLPARGAARRFLRTGATGAVQLHNGSSWAAPPSHGTMVHSAQMPAWRSVGRCETDSLRTHKHLYSNSRSGPEGVFPFQGNTFWTDTLLHSEQLFCTFDCSERAPVGVRALCALSGSSSSNHFQLSSLARCVAPFRFFTTTNQAWRRNSLWSSIWTRTRQRTLYHNEQ